MQGNGILGRTMLDTSHLSKMQGFQTNSHTTRSLRRLKVNISRLGKTSTDYKDAEWFV